MSCVLFALCLFLHTRHNDFPFSYHPDEPGKAAQLLQGRRNFHHPLLLLSATEYVSRLAFIPRTPQALVQTGRWVAAAFAAGAVVALALVVRLEYGAVAGWAAGFVLCLEPRLFEAAHYMKEDTALVFGFALGLLALQLWWRFPGRRTLQLLAVACAVSASGKYIGILFLLCALPFIFANRGGAAGLERAARLKTFALWFAGALVICNLPLFATKVSTPWRGLAREMDTVLGGHAGVTRQVPHGVYLEMLGQTLPIAAVILAITFAVALVATARRRSAVDWVVLLLPLGYLAVISCSPKIAPRYLLPVTTLLSLLAVCGATELARLIPQALRFGRVACFLMFFALLGWLISAQLRPYAAAYGAFQRDDPTAVAEWVNANVPEDALIAEDNSVSLSPSRPGVKVDVPPRVRQKVLESYFAADLGTLDDLRAKGVTHVAVSESMYARYFADDTTARASMNDVYAARRQFYERVFAEGERLADWPRGINPYLQPGIKIYRITPPSG